MRRRSYAVWWREGEGARHAGKLQLGSLHLLLTNGANRLALPLDDLVSVSYRRGELHLERGDGDEVHIGNLEGPGALLELADSLAG